MHYISKFIIGDLIRNKVLIGYLLLLSIIGWGIFFMESQPEKAHMLLLQATLIVVPIFSIVFSAIYFYSSKEFILLLVSQPVARKVILNGQYLGLIGAFTGTYFIGIGLPLMIFYPIASSYLLIISGTLLTIIFSSIALFIGVYFQDKAKGLGVVILLWAFFAFIFDGLLLLFMYQFGDYSIERWIIILTLLNPIDVARITVIMQTDISAMMGLSGAVFRKVLGGDLSIILFLINLVIWSIAPFSLAKRRFEKMDL